MTDQLQRAMAEYPDELRVVMEAAGWKYHEPIAAWRDESVEWTRTATDNDAIVACIEWLVNGGWQINLCEWTTTGLLIQALELVRQAEECDKRFEEMIR
jgi:hypothetical protein